MSKGLPRGLFVAKDAITELVNTLVFYPWKELTIHLMNN